MGMGMADDDDCRGGGVVGGGRWEVGGGVH